MSHDGKRIVRNKTGCLKLAFQIPKELSPVFIALKR